MTRTYRISIALLTAFAAVGTGCPDNPGGPCLSPCDEGFVCDEAAASCVRPSLEAWEGDVPGRSAQVVIAGGEAITLSVDPVSRTVISGSGEREEPFDFRVLGTVGRAATARAKLAASSERVAAVWLGDAGIYQVAWRDAAGRHDRWSTTSVTSAEATYQGTEHFDVAVEPDGSVQIAFRDRDRTLKSARHSPTLGRAGWTVETVDDGSPTSGGVRCVERDGGTRLGVGFDPDLALRDESAAISYFDVDCGDLRLATSSTDGWVVTAVDVGDPLPAAAGRGFARVGRFSSIGFEATGRPFVAYHDASLGRLLLATRTTGGDWDIEVVDRGVTLDVGSRERKDVVGAFSHLSFDERGLPAITYFDATATTLRIARRNEAGSWTRRALDDRGVTGFFAHHDYDATLGRVAVAEALDRNESGELVSQLRIVWEDGI